jgi:hypothetical protein
MSLALLLIAVSYVAPTGLVTSESVQQLLILTQLSSSKLKNFELLSRNLIIE